MRWLDAHAVEWDDYADTALVVAQSGNLDMLKWVQTRLPLAMVLDQYKTKKLYEATVVSGNVEMLQWLRECVKKYDSESNRRTMPAGSELFDLLWSQQLATPTWTDGLCEKACEHGHLDMLRWLQSEYHAAWDVDQCLLNAFGNNHLQVIEWLISHTGRERASLLSMLASHPFYWKGLRLSTLEWCYMQYAASHPEMILKCYVLVLCSVSASGQARRFRVALSLAHHPRTSLSVERMDIDRSHPQSRPAYAEALAGFRMPDRLGCCL